MIKSRFTYLLLVLFIFQPTLSLSAEKDIGSFFGRSRKTQVEKKAAVAEIRPSPVAAEAIKETTAKDEERAKLVVPPPIPSEPKAVHLMKIAPPKNAQDIPSPPPGIPGAPKTAPKPPAVPKTR